MWLRLEKVFASPPERVFAASIDAEQLRQWWGPFGFTVAGVQLEALERSEYRLTMQPPEGDVFHIRGTFREVEAQRRLVYTFAYEEPDPDDQETLVTVTFEPEAAGTRLTLDQGPFRTGARLELHRVGWAQIFERLDRFLAV